MKGLTLTQPYATLIALLAKQVETRSWRTGYRGPIAIHAGAGLGPVGGVSGLRRLCRDDDDVYRVLRDSITSITGSPMEPAETLPRGAILAVAELVECVEMDSDVEYAAFGGWVTERGYWELTDQERAFGHYAPGRYAWLLADVRPLRTPVSARGLQGLWTVPADIVAQLAAAEYRRAA